MDLVTISCSGGTAQVPLDVPAGMQRKSWGRGKFYEAPFLEYLRKTYHGGVWVDAGSALGNHTLFMAMFCDCVRVVSIDPVLDSLKVQTDILKLNGAQHKVETFSCALSNWSGFGKMDQFGPGVGHWRLIGHDVNGISVSTLDELRLTNVAVLKLDVEGGELAALQGAPYLLTTQRPAVFTEANTEQEVKALKVYLERFGYRHGRSFHTMHEWVT